jgi:hypothetical protein
VLEASFLDLSALNLSERNAEDGAVSVWPAWEVREHGGTLSWFHLRLSFPDGAGVDALAVVREGRVSIEDVRAEPALSLADLTVLADWIQGPLFASCGVTAERTEGREREEGAFAGAGEGVDDRVARGSYEEAGREAEREAGREGGREDEREERDRSDGRGPDACGGPGGGPCAGVRRARPAWPRGIEGRLMVAREYRAAQEEGADPVLAVMSATGRSRRRSLRLIAQARDAGFLTARHVRRE